jgi:lipoate-protein ligase B
LVEALEEVMIRTVADWRIKAERNILNRGVWIGRKKLGSIGIAIRRGISFHGFALNVNTSLEPFTWINPCGMAGVQMTSMKELLDEEVPMEGVRGAVRSKIQDIFGVQLKQISLGDIYPLMGKKGKRDVRLMGEGIR